MSKSPAGIGVIRNTRTGRGLIVMSNSLVLSPDSWERTMENDLFVGDEDYIADWRQDGVGGFEFEALEFFAGRLSYDDLFAEKCKWISKETISPYNIFGNKNNCRNRNVNPS